VAFGRYCVSLEMEASISLRHSLTGSIVTSFRSTQLPGTFAPSPSFCVRSVAAVASSSSSSSSSGQSSRVSNVALGTSRREEAGATSRPSRTKRDPPPKRNITLHEKLDKCGRLRTPRAARELSLSVLYAAFVTGTHPLKVFDDRMRLRAEGFDKSWLQGYEHCADLEENVFVEDEGLANALEEGQEAEAFIEAMVLGAPPPLVYNNFATRLARNLVKETADRWLQQEAILMEILPAKWKAAPKGALLQICILQMAIAEMETTDTSPNVIANEAVEVAKRFCDLAAPRIINGCLGSYTRRRKIKKRPAGAAPRKLEIEQLSEPLQPNDLGWNEDYLD